MLDVVICVNLRDLRASLLDPAIGQSLTEISHLCLIRGLFAFGAGNGRPGFSLNESTDFDIKKARFGSRSCIITAAWLKCPVKSCVSA